MNTPPARIITGCLATACAAFLATSAFSQGQVPTPPPTNPNLPHPRAETTGLAQPATTGASETNGASTAPAAESPSKSTAAPPDDGAMMQQMMEYAKLNENHKLLGTLAGNWSYTVKMWMAPGQPPLESKGTATRKPVMDGRFFAVDATGQFPMPGADGKMKDVEIKGTSLEGYDNVKKKFVATWADSMGTGMMISEGTYDPGTKTFSYLGEYEMLPGVKQKMRELVKIVDNDHYTLEMHEDHGGQDVKTMEIIYTRAGKK